MFDTIREYFETRRKVADAMSRAVDSHARLSSSINSLLRTAEAWLKTPSTRPASTVAFDLFTASLLRGVAMGSDDVACYLSKKAERARDEEARLCIPRRHSRVAEIIGVVHMSHGLLCSFLEKDDEATSIAVKIREHFPQRQVVIEDVGIAGKAHIIVRAVDAASGGESVH